MRVGRIGVVGLGVMVSLWAATCVAQSRLGNPLEVRVFDLSQDAENPSAPSAESSSPTDYAKENHKRITSAEVVGALGDDAFGEEVNLYTGATTFLHADLEVPGNSALPVRIARRFEVAHRKAPNEEQYKRPFAD